MSNAPPPKFIPTTEELDRLEREDILVMAGHFEAPGFGRVVRLNGRRYWRGL